MYDGRVGRWMTTDPYSQYHSPYLAMGNNPIRMIDPDGGFAFGGHGDPPLTMDNSGHTGTLLVMPKYYQTLIVTDFSYTNNESGLYSDIGFSATWQNWKYCSNKKIFEPISVDKWSNNDFPTTDHPFSMLIDFSDDANINLEMNKTYSIDGTVGAAGRGWTANGGVSFGDVFSVAGNFEQAFGGDGITRTPRFNVRTLVDEPIYIQGFGDKQNGMIIEGQSEYIYTLKFKNNVYPDINVRVRILHTPTDEYPNNRILWPYYRKILQPERPD